jgi:hypothetical protein
MSMKIFREMNFQKFQIFNPSAALAILLGVGGGYFLMSMKIFTHNFSESVQVPC